MTREWMIAVAIVWLWGCLTVMGFALALAACRYGFVPGAIAFVTLATFEASGLVLVHEK